jgi:hypothetical protein
VTLNQIPTLLQCLDKYETLETWCVFLAFALCVSLVAHAFGWTQRHPDD